MEQLTNQEFLYRQTPVDYDGTGTIVDIKGNTIPFNQLIQNGDFASTDGWTVSSSNITFTVNNNVATISNSNDGNSGISRNIRNLLVDGHKLYISFEAKYGAASNVFYFQPDATSDTRRLSLSTSGSGQFEKLSGITTIVTSSSPVSVFGLFTFRCRLSAYTLQVRNAMCFDLTSMGIDNLTTTAQVEEWLSSHIGNLPYYAYDTGSLLSFNGTGIKTTGKNQYQFINNIHVQNSSFVINADGSVKISNITNNGYIGDIAYADGTSYNAGMGKAVDLLGNNKIYFCTTGNRIYRFYYSIFDSNLKSIGGFNRIDASSGVITVSSSNARYIVFRMDYYQGDDFEFNAMACFSDTAQDFIPYLTNTLSLPISDKFPDGMDGVGTAFDELTPTDYYKRMGIVDLGNLTWRRYTTQGGKSRFLASDLNPIIKLVSGNSQIGNILCPKYSSISANNLYIENIGIAENTSGDIIIYDSAFDNETDPSVFKSAMSGVYLICELATPLHNYGVVDLGSLDWELNASTQRIFQATISDMKAYDRWQDNISFVSTMYIPSPVGNADMIDYGIKQSSNNLTKIRVRNTNFSDATTFKNAMSGVYLLYEKENPVQISPSLDLTYDIWDDGTEQLLPENSSVPTTSPILCDIDYRTMIPVNADDDPDGSGVITGTGNYRYHSLATLTATPTEEIYRFLRWEDENGNTLSTNPTYQFEVGDDE